MAEENNLPKCENEETFKVLEQTLFSLWDVANNLARIQPPKDHYRVTIFGSARTKPGDPLYDQVRDLAKRLAEMGCDIVTGGGPGLMQAANEGEQLGDKHGKTRSIGIRVELPFEQGANPYVERSYTHQTFFTRLHHFMRLSSAFVVVGGGIGTTLETMMVWQLLQVNHARAIPLIMVGDMWRGLVDWAKDHMLSSDSPFASPDDFNIPVCVDTVDEAVALVKRDKDPQQ